MTKRRTLGDYAIASLEMALQRARNGDMNGAGTAALGVAMTIAIVHGFSVDDFVALVRVGWTSNPLNSDKRTKP